MAKAPASKVKGPEITPIEEEVVKKKIPPLPSDADYVLRFAKAMDIGGHIIEKGSEIGTLNLKFGLTPTFVAQCVGRGITVSAK